MIISGMRCHDPRISNVRSEKRETENPALAMAEVTRQLYPEREIDWEDVARSADECDLLRRSAR
jgi:hypothetical protein